MSEKKTKGKPHRSVTEKTGYDWVTALPAPTNPKSIFFPEWCDDEINLISFSSLSHGPKHKDKTDRTEKPERYDKFGGFEDPQVLFLPFCLQDLEHDWKKPHDLFPEYDIVIYADHNEYSNLLENSAHLFESAFMRSFVSSIRILEYLAQTTKFAQEAMTSKYVPNASGTWKPWHHVYGGGKVGAGTSHNPQVNSIGKYIVRLFWLGAWRRVVIDDFLPVDITGHVLLPSLHIPPIPKPPQPSGSGRMSTPETKESKEKQHKPAKSDKKESQPKVILWPFLLAKGLLKLANMTMKKNKEMLQFNIVHCLTGWILQRLELKGLPSEDMWEICKTHTKLYSWENSELTQQASETGRRKKERKSKNEKANLSKILRPLSGAQKNSHYFMALCKDMRNLKQSVVSGMSPCWGHEILIDECRDIPLEKPPPNPDYPQWKKFRWMEWAQSKGMINEPVALDTTRYVRCLSPFAKFTKHLVHKSVTKKESKVDFPLRKSLALMQKQNQNADKNEQMEMTSSKYDLYREKSRERKLGGEPTPDPSAWIPFEDLINHLISFHIFYKPSAFHHKARISDMEMNDISDVNGIKDKTVSKINLKKNSTTWNDVMWPNVLEERGNMPLYFFVDSLDTKMILVNFAQNGDSERLVPLDDELSEHNFFVEYDRLFGDRDKTNHEEEDAPGKKLKLNRSRIHAGLKCSHLLLEKYKWNSAETGKVKFFLNTYGSSSGLLEIKPGRHIYRIWIKSEFSYCVTMLADTHFNVGFFEQIVEDMAEEPMRMTQFALDISQCFGNMVANFGTSNFPDLLRGFYRSYLPPEAHTELTKSQRYLIHKLFQRSFLQYLHYSQDLFTLQKFVDSLRCLFLDRAIRIQKQSIAVIPDRREQFQFQSLQEKIICERASTTLSAFFKMLQMKTLFKRHQPTDKHFSEMSETLRRLYVEIFSSDQRDECLGSIIRNFFKEEKMAKFQVFYSVHKDFKWDVTVQSYSGSSELSRDCVILCRYVLRCNEEVELSINLFCSLTNYVLRIIDNDTDEEIPRFTNQVFPRTFKPNSYGYTVIGFAWNKEMKLVNWKLVVISARTTTTKFDLEEIKTVTSMALDHYVPICKDLIGKHSIFVKENVIFTFRFSCSYRNVKFNVKLLDPAQNLIVDMEGKERIIMPAVLLKFASTSEVISHLPKTSRSSAKTTKGDHRKSYERPPSRRESFSARKREEIPSVAQTEPLVYTLEFHVVDNSWPLTKTEWEVVRKLREDTYYINSCAGKDTTIQDCPSKNTLKTGKDARKSMLRKVQTIEKPWYLLQYSFKANAQVALIKDKSEDDKVFALKKQWYQMDPDRYTRSFNLRQNYLKQFVDPGCQCPEEFTGTSPIESVTQSKLTVVSLETNSNTGPPKDEDDANAERTTRGPRWTEANVPPFDLTPYYRPQCPCPIDFRRKIVKTEKDHRADRKERQRMMKEYEDTLTKKRQDMELWINESNQRKTLVFHWYADCRRASESVFQENQVMRENFFEKWASELLPKAKSDRRIVRTSK